MKGRRQPQRAAATIHSSVKADSSYVARRIARHVSDLERTNYTEPTTGPLGIPIDNDGIHEEGASSRLAEEIESSSRGGSNARTAATTSKGKRKQTHNVRSLLLYRKSTAQLIQESGLAESIDPADDGQLVQDQQRQQPGDEPNYLTVKAGPSRYPTNELCSVCGAISAYRCVRCAMMTCSLACRDTHDETRCERR